MEKNRSNYLCEILHRLGDNAEKITMSFGSDEFKNQLLNMLDNDEARDEILWLLNIIVLKYTFRRVAIGFNKGEIFDYGEKKSKPLYTDCISDEECYDIAGDVYCEVVKRIDRFILNIIERGYGEKQRQAWLRKIVYCACANYLGKIGRVDFIVDSGDDEDDEIIYIPISDCRTPEYTAVCTDVIRNTITVACNAPFKPEKILGYLYNVMIFKEFEGRTRNNSSQKTCEYMNDKILFLLKGEFAPAFNRIYEIELSHDDIDGLSIVLGYDTATVIGNRVFSATPKLITDWSNRMKTYLYQFKFNLLDEDEEVEEINV